MHEMPPDLIHTLKNTRRVVAFTGAGLSAPSGIPTFRDARTGIWAQFRPEELATPEAFHRNPERVWSWYRWRMAHVARAEPNAGHRALVEMEKRIPEFTLITQNVDNLHQRAGHARVIELHGNLFRARCQTGRHRVPVEELPDDPVPRCPHCRDWLRPDVVWFGETLPPEAWSAAVKAATTCDLFFSIGTSTVVYPAASLPFEAKAAGARLVEVNPTPTPLSHEADRVLRGSADEILPDLVRATWPKANP